jgi:tetratricopeptide (TPR) repeat protein
VGERPVSLQDLIRRRQAGGFVGRQEELAQFQENLRLPAEDLRRRFLFSIHGDAGIGKTFLVGQFVRLAREQGYVTAYIDESVFDVPAAMEAITADLARQDRPCNEFKKRLETYQRHQLDLDADPTAPEGLPSTLTRSAVRIGLRAAEDIPLVGPFAKDLNTEAVAVQVDRMRTYLSRKLRNQHDVRLMLSPVDELTPTFVGDLRAIAAHQPVALFCDTYERTGAFLDTWLQDLLAGRYGDLPTSIVLTVAGQHPLDINTWGDYLSIRTDLQLKVFTDGEARELLATRGVTDNRVAEVILGLTARLPVLVAMLAEARPSNVEDLSDPSDNAVERFLKWEKDDQRRRAALHGALPRRLDQETFAAATGSTSAEADFTWLRGLPFVTEHSNGYKYHDVVRSTMLRTQHRRSPTDWQHRHTALADHYRNAHESLGITGPAAWKDDRWQALAVEEHYHNLCTNPSTALPAALEALIDTIDNNADAVPRWTVMVLQAGHDTTTPALIDRGQQLARWSTDEANRIDLLTHLAAESTLDDHHRAITYAERGNLYRQRNEYNNALADFTRAIELNPGRHWAIANRGFTYLLVDQYGKALTDLTKAIELNPKYDWAIANRGATYRLMGRYNDALTDFTKAIELNPKYDWAIANRGETYRLMGRYNDALTDFTKAIELNPKYDWAIASRGQTYQGMGRYDDALTDFTNAIELNPKLDWAIADRGKTYRLMGRYDDALTDFTNAIELDPKSGWEYYQIGLLELTQGRLDVAQEMISKAICIDGRSVEEFPRDGWRALNVAVYLLAIGKAEEARCQVQATIEQAITARDLKSAIADLLDLQSVVEVDVAELVDLLRSRLPCD